VDLDLLEADTRRARGERPYVMARVRQGVGIAEVVAFLEAEGGLALR
jgi:urease accessory protein